MGENQTASNAEAVALANAEVAALKPWALLELISHEPSHILPSKMTLRAAAHLVGRVHKPDVPLAAQTRIAMASISASHCRLLVENDERGNLVTMVEDLSSNGTFVNDGRIGKGKKSPLQDGDQLTIYKPKGRRTSSQPQQPSPAMDAASVVYKFKLLRPGMTPEAQRLRLNVGKSSPTPATPTPVPAPSSSVASPHNSQPAAAALGAAGQNAGAAAASGARPLDSARPAEADIADSEGAVPVQAVQPPEPAPEGPTTPVPQQQQQQQQQPPPPPPVRSLPAAPPSLPASRPQAAAAASAPPPNVSVNGTNGAANGGGGRQMSTSPVSSPSAAPAGAGGKGLRNGSGGHSDRHATMDLAGRLARQVSAEAASAAASPAAVAQMGPSERHLHQKLKEQIDLTTRAFGENEELRKRIGALNDDQQELREEWTRRLKEEAGRAEVAERSAEEANSELLDARKETADLRQEVGSLLAERDLFKGQASAHAKAAAAAHEVLQQTRGMLAEKEHSFAQQAQQLKEVRVTIATLGSQLGAAKALEAQHAERIEASEKELSALREQLTEYDARVRATVAEKEALESQLAELSAAKQQAMERLRANEELDEKNVQLEETVAEVRAQASKTEAELRAVQLQVTELVESAAKQKEETRVAREAAARWQRHADAAEAMAKSLAATQRQDRQMVEGQRSQEAVLTIGRLETENAGLLDDKAYLLGRLHQAKAQLAAFTKKMASGIEEVWETFRVDEDRVNGGSGSGSTTANSGGGSAREPQGNAFLETQPKEDMLPVSQPLLALEAAAGEPERARPTAVAAAAAPEISAGLNAAVAAAAAAAAEGGVQDAGAAMDWGATQPEPFWDEGAGVGGAAHHNNDDDDAAFTVPAVSDFATDLDVAVGTGLEEAAVPVPVVTDVVAQDDAEEVLDGAAAAREQSAASNSEVPSEAAMAARQVDEEEVQPEGGDAPHPLPLQQDLAAPAADGDAGVGSQGLPIDVDEMECGTIAAAAIRALSSGGSDGAAGEEGEEEEGADAPEETQLPNIGGSGAEGTAFGGIGVAAAAIVKPDEPLVGEKRRMDEVEGGEEAERFDDGKRVRLQHIAVDEEDDVEEGEVTVSVIDMQGKC